MDFDVFFISVGIAGVVLEVFTRIFHMLDYFGEFFETKMMNNFQVIHNQSWSITRLVTLN